MTATTGGVMALCESARQVRWLVRQRQAADISMWVAANCQAAWELERQRRPFVCLEAREDDRFKGIADELAVEQIGWAEQTDGRLHNAIPEFLAADFRPARHLLFHLKNICDTLVHRAAMLSRLADEHRPAEAVYFANATPLHLDAALRGVVGSALADVVPEWASQRRIHARPLRPRPRDRWWEYAYHLQGVARLRFAAARVVRQVLPGTAVMAIRERRRARWTDRQESAPNAAGDDCRPRVLVQGGYDINDGVGRALLGTGDVPVDARQVTTGRLSPEGRQAAARVKASMAKAWTHFAERRLGGWHRWSDLPVGEALERQLSDFWHKEVPLLWGHVVDARAALTQLNPAAVFGSVLYYDRRHIALAAAARGLGIPVVHYQHGGALGDLLETWDIAERYSGTHLLVYGTGCADYLRARPEIPGLRCQTLTVGSARLDALSRSSSSDRISALRRRLGGRPGVTLVVLVADVIHHNFFRVSGEYKCRSVGRFDVRRQVVRLLGRLESAQLVFKPFAMNLGDPTIEMVRMENAQAQIVTDVPLTDLQRAADLLVYESPGTALLEGTLTDKPLIVHCDRSMFRFDEGAIALLGRRAVVADDAAAFLRAIEDAVVRPGPSPTDTAYRRAFATHLDDGRSAERVAAAVSAIVGAGRRSAR